MSEILEEIRSYELPPGVFADFGAETAHINRLQIRGWRKQMELLESELEKMKPYRALLSDKDRVIKKLERELGASAERDQVQCALIDAREEYGKALELKVRNLEAENERLKAELTAPAERKVVCPNCGSEAWEFHETPTIICHSCKNSFQVGSDSIETTPRGEGS